MTRRWRRNAAVTITAHCNYLQTRSGIWVDHQVHGVWVLPACSAVKGTAIKLPQPFSKA